MAGRRRLRGPGAEERGISTPRVSREKRPSPLLPRKRGRASACPFSPPENPPGRPRRPPGGAPLIPGTPRAGGVQAAGTQGLMGVPTPAPRGEGAAGRGARLLGENVPIGTSRR